MNISSIIQSPGSLLAIPLLLLIILITKLVPSLFLTAVYGFRKGLAAGVLLSSQLSLMIVGAQLALHTGFISNSLYSSLILTIILSCLIFPPIFDKLYPGKPEESADSSILDRVQIKEIIPVNSELFNKKLRDINFPDGCRIFLIVRGNQEVLPDGNTEILSGDKLVAVGFPESMKTVDRIFGTESVLLRD